MASKPEEPGRQGKAMDDSEDRDTVLLSAHDALKRGQLDRAVSAGALLAEQGDLEAAERIFREADDMGNADAARHLGDALRSRHQDSRAEDAYRRAAERGSADGAFGLGQMLGMRDDRKGSESAYRRADELGSADAANHLGVMWHERNDFEDAEQAFRRAITRGNKQAITNLGLMEMARANGERAEAEQSQHSEGGDQLEEAAGQPVDPDEAAPHLDASTSVFREAEPFGLTARAISDLPAQQDVLGFAPLVEGLRALLSSRRTQLPLAIAVTAPWGAGKSSVMLQLRELLRSPGDRQPRERTWWTVDFAAWKYERSERLWAALAKAIYEQPQADMGVGQRVAFRVRVEWTRLGWRKFLLKSAWPPVAAAVAVLTALAVGDDLGSSEAPAATLVTSAAAFVTGAAHYWGIASKPFKRAIERYASAPAYESQLGFTAEADRDIRSLTRVLAPDTDDDPHALAVFVDDLDRCSSTHVVEVVEAMNQIFNSDERHGCVFVLGMDREVVATSIEVAHQATVKSLKDAGRGVGEDFGMSFLAKLVQLSVAVPRPNAEAIERLLAQVAGSRPPASPEAPSVQAVETAEEEIRQQAPETLEEVGTASSDADLTGAAAQAAERRMRALLIGDSPDVVTAEFEVLRSLDRNPRQIKRFDNAFRLQLYVANEDPECRLDFSLDQLVALGKWVALRLRWPELAEALDDEPALIEALEASANDDGSSLSAVRHRALEQRYSRWFSDPVVSRFLRDVEKGAEARRLARLEPGSFLRVA